MGKILMIGSGLANAVIADKIRDNYNVTVFEKNDFIGGTCYTENVDGIEIHKFGPHIFRTNKKEVWDYINTFSEFNNFINCPIAIYDGKVYNMPFNMNTFSKLWTDVTTPEQAKERIQKEIDESGIDVNNITNLEEKAISLVGTTIYKMLVKEYTEKQWGKDCKDLPPSIINRLPLRFTYNNNYFNDRYQGIPVIGYTKIIEKMFDKSHIIYNAKFKIKDYEENKDEYDYIIYSGRVDELLDYKFGKLEYRGLYWDTERIEVNNYQGNAVVNYPEHKYDYTRITEHKHFTLGDDLPYTFISKEHSIMATDDPDKSYYPIETERNIELYKKYVEEIKNKYPKLVLSGRLGNYKYYDMTNTIEKSFELSDKILKGEI